MTGEAGEEERRDGCWALQKAFESFKFCPQERQGDLSRSTRGKAPCTWELKVCVLRGCGDGMREGSGLGLCERGSYRKGG